MRKNAAAAVRSFWRYASQEAGLQRRLSGFEVKVLAERVGLCRSRLEAIPPSLGASRGTARLTWLEIKDRAKVSSGDTVEAGRASRRACSPSRTQTWFLTQPVSAKQKAPRGAFVWRREWDSNPRYVLRRTHAFQACDLNRSSISPDGAHFSRC